VKTCISCNLNKQPSEFVRDRRRSDGLYPRCVTCSRVYYHRNREAILAKNKAYRDKNRIRVRLWNKAYSHKRFFFTRAQNLKVREYPKDVSTVFASPKELALLWKAQKGICPFTGRRLNRQNSQLDHIVPLVKGGTSEKSNLRWVHRDVNYAKRDLLDAEFLTLCQDIAAQNGYSK
jgi:5-methylcytosine-specific restriction endonuclease McrA